MNPELRSLVLGLSLQRAPASIVKTQNPSHPTQRVIELAGRIATWHETRPVPDRWQPVLLGRVAARFGTCRELAAAALAYAGWTENRIGVGSWWTAPAFTQPPAERK